MTWSQPEEEPEFLTPKRPAKRCAGNCFLDLKFVHENPNSFIVELQRFLLFCSGPVSNRKHHSCQEKNKDQAGAEATSADPGSVS